MQNMLETKANKLLEQAKTFYKEHLVNPLEQGNLFTVLDMENKEVSAHSAFLYFVFKPFRIKNGDYDDGNLRALLKELLRVKACGKNVEEYKCLDIRREVPFEYGRLDFVVTADNDIYIIELKIKAGEQPGQIDRYRKYLMQNGVDENNIFFLTPVERKSESGNSINITLKKNIKKVLVEICEIRKDCADYTSMLRQYISLIEKLTAGDNGLKSTLSIIKSQDDILAVEELIADRRRCLQAMMIEFFGKLKDRLGMEICIDGAPKAILSEYRYGAESIEKYYLQNKKSWPALAYKIEISKRSKEYFKNKAEPYFFIEIENNLYCGITPRIEEKDGLHLINIDEAFDGYTDLLENQKIAGLKRGGAFISWNHLKCNGRKINFSVESFGGYDSCRCLMEDGGLGISDKRMDELTLQIRQEYTKHCKAVFDFNS